MWIADKIYYQNSSSFTRAYQGSELVWEKPTQNYITFTSLKSGLTPPSEIGLSSLATGQTIEYSYDGYNWSSMTTSTAIEVENGQSVYLRGMLISDNTSSNYTNFNLTGKFKVSGNINYLWNYNNPNAALKPYCGYKLFSGEGLFSGQTALSDVSELALPATILANNCYQDMFLGCSKITTAPVLPATTLATHCYSSMFNSCTSLTSAPALPATTLTGNCYMYMFKGCTSLTTAPTLPATALTGECYREMFWGCTSLTTAPALPATTLAGYCYAYMFKGCTSLTTAPSALPATALTEGCYSHIFDACYNLTTAPTTLPATTLADYCYDHMFYACTSLTTAPELPAATLAEYCYYGMFKNCYSLNYIKCLATDISATNSTAGWVDSVSGSGTFVKDENMTGWTIGINGIPSGWTVVNEEVSAVTFTAKANSSSVGLTKISTGQTLEYSTDGNTWSNMTTSTSISLSSGQSVYIRGTLSSNNSDSNNTQFTMSGDIKASGNINYLWDKDNPDAALKGYCGAALFSGCTALTDVSELELPSTTLSERCYRNMFRNTRITTPPVLPATTLATYCYSSMFNSCTSLTSAPALPATTLATYCYYYMFENCSALTTAPELPAATLVNYCYNNMFKNCSSLNYIKCLATNISASNCTVNWVSGVASTGTFAKASSMSSWTTGNNGIPTNWTVVGPDLTKKHWWTATNGVYNFNLPTRWNNGYCVEVDQYFTASGNTSNAGSVLRQNSDNSPLEVFYTGGFYFDAHYPNSTTSPTVNTTDYDHRVSLSRTTFNSYVQPNVKYTFKYEMTPTQAIRIYSGSTLVYQTTYNSGNKNWCTTGDYSLYAASMAARSGWCVVSDIRVYDNNNSLIHNFQLYPSPNPDVLGYEYLDIVTDTWYPVVNGSITKVETTDR